MKVNGPKSKIGRAFTSKAVHFEPEFIRIFKTWLSKKSVHIPKDRPFWDAQDPFLWVDDLWELNWKWTLNYKWTVMYQTVRFKLEVGDMWKWTVPKSMKMAVHFLGRPLFTWIVWTTNYQLCGTFIMKFHIS